MGYSDVMPHLVSFRFLSVDDVPEIGKDRHSDGYCCLSVTSAWIDTLKIQFRKRLLNVSFLIHSVLLDKTISYF